MSNCTANVPRAHQFAMSDYGTAVDAAFTRRLAISNFALKGTTNTVVDDGIADSLWDQADGEVIATEQVSGQLVLNPRAADLQAICRCIFGGAAFATNTKLPGTICDYFQVGHLDPYCEKVYRYNNCVTSQAVFSAQEAGLLNLAWTIEGQSRTMAEAVGDWPVLALSKQQPFVFRQGTLTIGGDTFKMKQFNFSIDNMLQMDFFNSLHREEMPQGGQSFVLTHDSPWDLDTEADRIGTAQDVSADLDFVSGTKRIRFEFPRLYAIIDEPEITGRARILNSYSWRAKHEAGNAINAPVRITVVGA
jgi:hypothetical protein